MKRTLPLALAAIMIFVVAALLLLKVMPGPLKDADYLIIGSVATLAAMAVMFVVILATSKSSDVFFKRRKK
jgi:ABC-type Fe3+-siderophore transport system permease subunit